MNSYSRDTLRHGHFSQANGPYGAPRGNPVMKAKRVSGESAQSKLCRVHTAHVAKERAWLDSLPGIAKASKPFSFAPDPLGRRSMFGN